MKSKKLRAWKQKKETKKCNTSPESIRQRKVEKVPTDGCLTANTSTSQDHLFTPFIR